MNYVGLDLGQARDHSAIAVLSRLDQSRAYGGVADGRGASPDAGAYMVRHVERAPLGTSYPKVVERVREIVSHPDMEGQCALAVDATGLGAPVVEMLRAARLSCEMSAVVITGGEREHRSGSGWNVPKRDLMAGVQVLLERGELKIARRLRETGALVQELMDVQVSQGKKGRVRIGADGVGQHDDLVIAVALAVWRAGRRSGIGFGGGRLPGI